MRLLINVYDANGNPVGDGPIVTAMAVSVTRVLDGAGSVSLDFPAGDRRVAEHLRNKYRAHVWLDYEDGTAMREMARMVIEKNQLKQAISGYMRGVDGPDNLGELAFTNVRRGRKYNAATVQAVVDDLLSLTTGWSRSGAATGLVSARFDGASIKKALIALVERQGIHFRQNPLNVIEIGSFGDDCGYTVMNREIAPEDEVGSTNILVDNLTLEEDSEDLFNWLEPIGAGEGDAAATLEKAMATRSIALGYAYDIQTETGPDGRTVYYLLDTPSKNTYGQIEKTGVFNDITPVGTSEADLVALAEALYDAAVATLTRFKDAYKAYSLTCRLPNATILPGDKIRLRDEFSIVDDDGNLVNILDIDEMFWVMQTSEMVNASGSSLKLKIASVDRVQMDEAEVVVGIMESVQVSNLSVKASYSKDSYIDFADIDATHPVTFEIVITERTQTLQIATLRLVTSPFRANVRGSASGGGSATTSASGGSSAPTSTSVGLSSGLMIPIGGDHRHDIAPHSHDVTISAHTHGITIPSHTHAQDYGIYDDTDYPDNVNVSVDGQAVAIGLDPSGAGLDQVFDITEELTAGALQTTHTIVITCDGGQGNIKVHLEMWELIQNVAVFS